MLDTGSFTEENRKLANAMSENGNTVFKILTCPSYLDKIFVGYSKAFSDMQYKTGSIRTAWLTLKNTIYKADFFSSLLRRASSYRYISISLHSEFWP